MISNETLEKVLAALRFYANGDNRTLLTGFKNGVRIDWDEERRHLKSMGYSMSCEYYNGTEDYIEDGRTAQEALDALEKELDVE